MGALLNVCRDLMGVTVPTLADVLKPAVPTEVAKQALLCHTDEGSKHFAFLSGR
jgi:hypothetical protein